MPPVSALLWVLLASEPVPAPPTPVLVELFTSEGCSSCPAADALLRQLAAEQAVAGARIVVLSEHVDYWDGLGWRDPFSDAAFTRRQLAYVRGLGLGGAYTPQAIVDGERDVVGSDRRALLGAVASAAVRPKGTIRLRPGVEAGTLAVEATWPGQAVGEVFLALVEAEVASDVTRGENQGRRLVHGAVVRALVRAGEGQGRFRGLFRPPGGAGRGRSLVAFAQAKGSGAILAIGELAPLVFTDERL
jgi:hypothetical protein